MVRSKDEGWLQGFITITTFTIWHRHFQWNSLHPEAGMEDESHGEGGVIDEDGSISRELQEQVWAGDPHGEGVSYPHIAELSLLGAIGSGGFLVKLMIEELEAEIIDPPYEWCVYSTSSRHSSTSLPTSPTLFPRPYPASPHPTAPPLLKVMIHTDSCPHVPPSGGTMVILLNSFSLV